MRRSPNWVRRCRERPISVLCHQSRRLRNGGAGRSRAVIQPDNGATCSGEAAGFRRYRAEDLDVLQALACMRALGVGIEDMRAYQANRGRGHEAAAEQRDLLLRHAERIEAEIAAQRTRLDYLRAKAALWDARARGDTAAEAGAWQRVRDAFNRMDMEMEIKR